jgi:hypothetical protein
MMGTYFLSRDQDYHRVWIACSPIASWTSRLLTLSFSIQFNKHTDGNLWDFSGISRSQTSRLLTSSLSLGVPVPLQTQCMYGRRVDDDLFPLSLCDAWFCSTLGVPIPTLIGSSHPCDCNVFHYDSFGDHLQTC